MDGKTLKPGPWEQDYEGLMRAVPDEIYDYNTCPSVMTADYANALEARAGRVEALEEALRDADRLASVLEQSTLLRPNTEGYSLDDLVAYLADFRLTQRALSTPSTEEPEA